MSLKLGVPECWMVTINGTKFKGPYYGSEGRRQAEAVAERFQGNSQSINGRVRGGFLKHRDKGQHVEVKRDREAEERWVHRIDDFNNDRPQKHTIIHSPGELD